MLDVALLQNIRQQNRLKNYPHNPDNPIAYEIYKLHEKHADDAALKHISSSL